MLLRFRDTFFGGALLAFLHFQSFPVALDLGRGVSLHVSKHMRMTIDQLAGEPIENVIDGKRRLLFRHLGVEQNLQQEIAQFAREFGPVAVFDGFQDLVCLFQCVGLDGIKGLFAIPGTPAGGTQAFHDSDGAFETFSSSRH